ncbi:MAG TPA: DUF4173 domain-containing protein [Candidatus Limnocylindria bacterium]
MNAERPAADDLREAVAAVPRAVAILLASAGLGLLAQLLFFEVGLGINYPLMLAALLAAGWLIAGGARLPRLTDAWLPVAALVLGAFVALRGDRTLLALDVLGSLLLAGASLASFGGQRVVERPLAGVMVLAGRVLTASLAAGVAPLRSALEAVDRRSLFPRLRSGMPVVRGLLIAIPLLALFGILFASADAVFSRIAGDLLGWDLDLGSLPGRALLTLLVAWLAAGLLTFVVRADESDAEGALEGAWAGRPRLGSTEAVTVLVALDLLFAIFVVVQAAYLFGGQDTRAASGMTYAGYARRGFFELLAVAFAVGGLVLAGEALVARRTRAYVAAFVALVLLTLVVLASAFLRLRLYQDAYGWTELRFYVFAAIAWLAIGAVGAIAALLADRTAWLLHGLAVLSVAFGIGFNLVGPVHFVAERNLERVNHPETIPAGGERDLDVDYLVSLGSDAVDVVQRWMVARPLPPELAERMTDRMAEASGLDEEGNRAWQAWNLSRARARELPGR